MKAIIKKSFLLRVLFLFTAGFMLCTPFRVSAEVVIGSKTGVVYETNSDGTAECVELQNTNKTTVKISSKIIVNGVRYEVTSIAADAFKNNSYLKKVVIPASVEKIGKEAFYNCQKLKSIKINSKALALEKGTVGANAFGKLSYNATICAPRLKSGAFKEFKKVLYDRGFRGKIKIFEGGSTVLEENTIPKEENTIPEEENTSPQKKKQTITVSKTIAKTYGQEEMFNLEAKAEGKLTYETSNKKVAIVSSSGTVTIKGCGTVVITVKAAETTEYMAETEEVKLTVAKGKQTITVNKAIEKIYGQRETFHLGAKAEGKLTYRSSNPKVAVISTLGVVTIKGCGATVITVKAAATAKYTSEKETVQLTVVPGKIQLTSVTSEREGYLKFQWERNSQVSGYEINYSTDKTFTSAKRGTVSSNRTTEGNKSGLVSGQIYYVRIRGYILENGVPVYGPWSTTKYCKVK